MVCFCFLKVAHAIARHSAEMITKSLWLAIVQLILLQFFFMPDLINAMSTLLLRLPFSRRYFNFNFFLLPSLFGKFNLVILMWLIIASEIANIKHRKFV